MLAPRAEDIRCSNQLATSINVQRPIGREGSRSRLSRQTKDSMERLASLNTPNPMQESQTQSRQQLLISKDQQCRSVLPHAWVEFVGVNGSELLPAKEVLLKRLQQSSKGQAATLIGRQIFSTCRKPWMETRLASLDQRQMISKKVSTPSRLQGGGSSKTKAGTLPLSSRVVENAKRKSR